MPVWNMLAQYVFYITQKKNKKSGTHVIKLEGMGDRVIFQFVL